METPSVTCNLTWIVCPGTSQLKRCQMSTWSSKYCTVHDHILQLESHHLKQSLHPMRMTNDRSSGPCGEDCTISTTTRISDPNQPTTNHRSDTKPIRASAKMARKWMIHQSPIVDRIHISLSPQSAIYLRISAKIQIQYWLGC